jgi:hypothetical protein
MEDAVRGYTSAIAFGVVLGGACATGLFLGAAGWGIGTGAASSPFPLPRIPSPSPSDPVRTQTRRLPSSSE